MNTLDRIWDAGLSDELQELEELRKRTQKQVILRTSLAGVAALGLAFFLSNWAPLPFCILGALAAIWMGRALLIGRITRTFEATFKQLAVSRIVSGLQPGLGYQPLGRISPEIYKGSGLFNHSVDRYHGEDHVRGVVGKTRIEFSELHTQYESEDSEGKTRYVTVFKGVFFVADFNKNFSGTTLVLPDRAERFLGEIGRIFQKFNFRDENLVHLEDPEFEEQFAAFSENDVEARYILTPDLMARLVELKKRIGKVQISFINNKVHVAVDYSGNFLKVSLFRSVLERDLYRKYIEEVELFLLIVKDLDLNTRIWSKE